MSFPLCLGVSERGSDVAARSEKSSFANFAVHSFVDPSIVGTGGDEVHVPRKRPQRAFARSLGAAGDQKLVLRRDPGHRHRHRHALERFATGEAIGRENGPLEHVQLLLMFSAALLFVTAGRRGDEAVRVSGTLLAAMVLAAFIRELDFKSFAVSGSGLYLFFTYQLRDLLLAWVGVGAIIYCWRERMYLRSLVRLGLRRQAWPFAVGLLLLVAAELVLDRMPGPSGRFWEELLEVHGYVLLCVASWRHVDLTAQTAGT